MDPVTIRFADDTGTGGKPSSRDVALVPFSVLYNALRELKLAVVVLLLTLTYLLVVWLLASNHEFTRPPNDNQVTNLGLSLLDEDPVPDRVTFENTEPSDISVRSETTTDNSEPRLTIEDVFLSVKTTKKFHRSRLDVILQTWFKLARDQVRVQLLKCSFRSEFEGNDSLIRRVMTPF